jgi:hypothetical protein
MDLAEILGQDREARNALNQEDKPEEQVEDKNGDVEEESEEDGEQEDELPAELRTRSGRAPKMPSQYIN